MGRVAAGAAGHDSDVTENLLREVVLPTGLVDVKVAALGEDWSGLRFVWRRRSGPGGARGLTRQGRPRPCGGTVRWRP